MSSTTDWQTRNREVIKTFRANRGTAGQILLTTIGAKSGKEFTTPLVYTNDGDRIVIIASKGGAPTHPDWYHNLVANPIVTVELGADRFAAHAHVAEGPEHTRLYQQMAEKMPFFADYQRATTRQIPVIILERMH